MAWTGDFKLKQYKASIIKIMNAVLDWQNIIQGTDYQDMYQCTDLKCNEGKLGVRIRDSKYMIYDDWTIRYKQWQKLCSSPITHYFYAYQKNNKLHKIYIIDVNQFRKYSHILHQSSLRYNNDGTCFYSVKFSDLLHYGCIVMKAYINNNNKVSIEGNVQ